jgi:hypothetical protein
LFSRKNNKPVLVALPCFPDAALALQIGLSITYKGVSNQLSLADN